MTFGYFLKLFRKSLLWLIIIPVVLAVSIYYFTKGEKKVYSSESVIYTGIASGYSLNGNNKADFFETSNAFDNLLSLINSRETKQEVAIDLLASHLVITKHNPALISWDAFAQLKILVPDSIRKILVKSTLEETISAVRTYMSDKEGNLIYTIINSDNPFYSFDAMDNVKAIRINNSDLIKISYQTNDAVICKQTLELLEQCFMKKHRLLKEGQSESVVDYFETETHNAFSRLNDAEQSFMEFNKQNDIINYYEQTKAVAIEKENLDAQNHDIEMDKMANSKSLDKVNENIKGRLYQDEYGTAILKNRDQLSDVYNKIAVSEIVGTKEINHQSQLDSLKSISSALETKLNTSVNNLYEQTLTPNGIPTKSVLDEWIKSTLAFEQSKARLSVMGKRKIEFLQQYRKFAPLGATLKKIERQINVSEQEYLELLHGLNMAKLTQQNNELTTKLNIVDPPYLPLKANKSKRLMLIIVGFFVGFFLILAIILAKALVNKTLQKPDRASQVVHIPLTGIYPLLNSNPDFIAKANLRLIQQLLSKTDTSTKPATIGFISTQSKEGKSTIMDVLEKELSNLNYKVEKKLWNKDLFSTNSSSDIILLKFPALESTIIKPGIFPKLDHSFLVSRANRTWNKLDKELLDMFSKATDNHPSLILNGVNTDFAEEYIGEIIKKKRFFRRAVKNSKSMIS